MILIKIKHIIASITFIYITFMQSTYANLHNTLFLFFFFMIRRPLISTLILTLFPYTTLFRSLNSSLIQKSRMLSSACDWSSEIGRAHVCTPVTFRKLVCRLLLETKKEKHQ